MKAIRGRQPLIPSLWSLEPQTTSASPDADPERITPSVKSTERALGDNGLHRSQPADPRTLADVQQGAAASFDPHPPAVSPSQLKSFEGSLGGAEQICALPLDRAALAQGSGGDVWMDSVPAGTAPLPLDQTFRLQSNPGASKVIYLDFNGHTTTGTGWNDASMGSSFYSPAFDRDGNPGAFSSDELMRIQLAWQYVASDFAPFDVNVTTMEPPADWLVKSGSADANYGVRAVMTSYGPLSATTSGIAEVGSFNFSVDSPVFIYNNTIQGMSRAISHEVGHSLGLSHDGTTAGVEYYWGYGTGETAWGPIMGGGLNNVLTWDDGSYSGSNNGGSGGNYGQGGDDLAVITRNNGFGFRADQVGNNQASASPLAISGGAVGQFGTIETRLDTDWYSFQLNASGDLDLTFDPYCYRAYSDNDGVWGGDTTAELGRISDLYSSTGYVELGSNLDLAVQLYDDQGKLLASVNDAGLAAHLTVPGLAAGQYCLKLDGVGTGDPAASPSTGYSDYASIGSYWISGSIGTAADSTAMPFITLSLSPNQVTEDGSGNLVFTLTRSLVTTDPLTVNLAVGGSAANGSDYTGLLPGTNQAVTFAANAPTTSVVIDPTADPTYESDETVSLQLLPGSGYSLGILDPITGIISNDDPSAPTAATLNFTSGVDSLTGTSVGDRFVLNRLSDALWSSNPDRILNLQAGTDTIDSPQARSNPLYPKQLGAVKTLDSVGLSALLTNKTFAKNGAVSFTFDSGSSMRTFLAINDGVSGFNANSDSIIEITGFTGSLSSLGII